MKWKINPDDLKNLYFSHSNAGFAPTCDIHENDDFYMISLDVPGLGKNDLKIEIQGRKMLVSGERKKVGELGHDSLSLKRSYTERTFGSFERIFNLPQDGDFERMEAHCQDGVLQILIPKSEVSKPRVITIKDSKKDEHKAANQTAVA